MLVPGSLEIDDVDGVGYIGVTHRALAFTKAY